MELVELRRRLGSRAGTTIVLAALVGLLTSCDGADPSRDLSGAQATAPSDPAGSDGMAPDAPDTDAATSAARDPELESVGPDGSTRIYYQFVDDTGRVQFVERIADVPTAWRDRVGFVEMNQAPPLTPQAARRTWQLSSERAAEVLASSGRSSSTAQASRASNDRSEVVLYYASWCGYCRKAKAHLDAKNVAYEIRNVDNQAVKRELREKTGRSGIPVLDFSGEILRGYSRDAYDRAIRSIQG